MASGEDVTALVDRLIGLFNARSMDLPDGWFTRHTQLLLNGVPIAAGSAGADDRARRRRLSIYRKSGAARRA
jgi:hypothetical protein